MKTKFWIIAFFILIYAKVCSADDPSEYFKHPTAGLKNGTASLYEASNWAAKGIEQWALSYGSSDDTLNIIYKRNVNDSNCASSRWMFIKVTPTCGSGNCDYLVFEQKDINKDGFKFVGDVETNEIRYRCYSNENNAVNNYLIGSWHSSAEEEYFMLLQLTDSKIIDRGTIILRTALNKNDALLQNQLLDKSVSEQTLLNAFAKAKVQGGK